MSMSCRYTEEKTTAAGTVAGPAPQPTSAKRELSDGTDETLTCFLPWFFLVPTMGALNSKELPLPHIAKFKELATEMISLDNT